MARALLPLLLLVTAGIYARSLTADFVYDARAQVLTDRFIHTPSHFWDVLTLRVMSMDVLDFNRPVHLLSMMIDAALWGERPFGFHLTSVLLHLATVSLVFLLGRKLTGNAMAAFGGALIFALHPLNCEAVAEPSYREDLLAAFFSVGAMYVTALQARGWSVQSWWAALAVPVLCFLAVGAKETGVVAPLLVLATASVCSQEAPGSRRLFYGMTAAAVLVVSGFLAARFALQPETSVIWTEKPKPIAPTFVDILLIQTRIWTFYLSKFFWPAGLSAEYTPYTIRAITLGWSIPVVLAVLVLQGWGSVKSRVFLLGALTFWAALLPVSNFVPTFRPMADRFLYFPMAGMALCLCAVASLPAFRRWLPGVLCVVAIPLAVATFQRQAVWQNSLTLWTDAYQKNPHSFTNANNLASALAERGQDREAVPYAEQAIRLTNGKVAEAFATMAFALAKAGDPVTARRALAKAIELDPIYGDYDRLVASLTWERKNAAVLKELAIGLDSAP